jgi:peptidoglycan hydrolase CwlO-like protein
MASREAESLKTSSGELEGARDSLHKKDLELTRARQTVASKDSLIADLQAEKEQMRKRIGQLEGQGDADKQEYRARVGHLEQRIADQDKKQRQAEN